ncbi:hypothetical protein PH586_20830 [Pseudomonas sp. SA3-5]|uniref:DUF4340 domain-containing protein n=1 Tax=Pseudomonas aestuarii TaxID=3018340 RepID=A0ABT4XL43_9PSED|nr:hypothetical protein [Pseudomonas aestuarii]MDA7088828.1 hypothetical protein [Pseudomonas aestuarii]
MKMPPLRVQHGLIFVVVALLFFAWGAWLMRPQPAAAPLPWLAEWQAAVLEPLADDRLSLAMLRVQADGELWLQPPRLLYRADWQASGTPWTLEAELGLSEAERDSLMAAVGVGVRDAEQPLSKQLLAELGTHAVVALSLKPQQAVAAEQLVSSIGQPRLRLELGAGQAWVYPEAGLTAHTEDDQLQLLRVVPRDALHQRQRNP